MSRGNRYNKKESLMPECFRKRLEAYPKCEYCEYIYDCSRYSLIDFLVKKGFQVETKYGSLVHVDPV